MSPARAPTRCGFVCGECLVACGGEKDRPRVVPGVLGGAGPCMPGRKAGGVLVVLGVGWRPVLTKGLREA
ncbi:hypothetical protein GCM10010363_76660 [Streptomyces omiyaensis]|nr:hypothetical protein GCM10010363_76660 [Streptomyces omiyaensis]